MSDQAFSCWVLVYVECTIINKFSVSEQLSLFYCLGSSENIKIQICLIFFSRYLKNCATYCSMAFALRKWILACFISSNIRTHINCMNLAWYVWILINVSFFRCFLYHSFIHLGTITFSLIHQTLLLGKSTLACALSRNLHTRGKLSYILDGDNIRHGLNQDLSFGAEDRSENIRRIGELLHKYLYIISLGPKTMPVLFFIY